MKQYSSTSKLLHWLVAALIIAQYVLAEWAQNARSNGQLLEQLALLANHKSIGITILVLALVRLFFRFRSPSLDYPETMSEWQVRASKASHFLLYGFLFALPLSGWLMSSATAYSVSYFNLFSLPDLLAPNESVASWLQSVHYYLGEALFYIALVHIAAALKHHFFDKDDVLIRISSKLTWLVFVAVSLTVILVFGRVFDSVKLGASGSQKIESTIEAADDTALGKAVREAAREVVAEVEENVVKSALPRWNIDYQKSSIKFIGDQAGAPFEGEWQQWEANIQFDASRLSEARFDVVIDVASGFSNDQERDDTIRSTEFFNVAEFPEASYKASDFIDANGLYQSNGQLFIKGITAEVPLDFTVMLDQDGSHVLEGTALLNRLSWNIGTGQWLDTSWVGQDVKVQVRVVTKPE